MFIQSVLVIPYKVESNTTSKKKKFNTKHEEDRERVGSIISRYYRRKININ
jgi:hypothetical protein